MKNQYACEVNGIIKDGRRVGVCGKKIIGENNKCGAHGNTKCEHKNKIGVGSSNSRPNNDE